MFKKKFYYGDGTNHIVKMTENQALACNRAVFKTIKEDEGSIYGTLHLPDGCTMDDYNRATTILNKYHKKVGAIRYDNEDQDVLRPVK